MVGDDLPLKTRIAMLWVFIAFVMVARQLLAAVQQVAAGQPELQLAPLVQVWSAGATLVVFAIPFLCLTLKSPLNRWFNIVLGLFFAVAGVAGTGSELFQFTASNLYFYMMDAAATAAPAVVLFYAYRWPKEDR